MHGTNDVLEELNLCGTRGLDLLLYDRLHDIQVLLFPEDANRVEKALMISS